MRMRRRRSRPAILAADVDMHDMFLLNIGPSGDFTAEEEARLRDLWFAVRDAYLPAPTAPDGATEEEPDRAYPGTRPWAWWRFQAEEPWPRPSGREFQRLRELGVLEPWEEEAALRRFRQAVRISRGMGAERIAEWLGLPLELVREWLNERREVSV